jgi:PilZ domain
MEQERDRRHSLRFPFDASADLAEENSPTRVVAHVSEISLNGCFLQTATPLAEGTMVVIKIFTEGRFFEARAKVVYSKAKVGMGVTFYDVKPFFASVLKKWLLTAMAGRQKPVAD